MCLFRFLTLSPEIVHRMLNSIVFFLNGNSQFCILKSGRFRCIRIERLFRFNLSCVSDFVIYLHNLNNNALGKCLDFVKSHKFSFNVNVKLFKLISEYEKCTIFFFLIESIECFQLLKSNARTFT